MRHSSDYNHAARMQYRSKLAELVELTRDHIDNALWLLWALAQRVNADVKIAASIEYIIILSPLFYPRLTKYVLGLVKRVRRALSVSESG